MPGDSSAEMSCSLRPVACSGVAEDCAEAILMRAIFKTLKVMNIGNVRARVLESDKSVFMNWCSS
jgi:hypothetical protein